MKMTDLTKRYPALKFLELNERKKANFKLWLLAFALAFFLWVYIASSISSDMTLFFSNIPVKIDLTGTEAAGYGLHLLSVDGGTDIAMKVDVSISGNRTAIGGLNQNDIEVYVDFDSDVRDQSGNQTLPIKLRTTNGAAFTEYNLSRDSVVVSMDHYETLTVPVREVTYPHLSFNDETIVKTEDINFEPATVEITGPTSQLSSIDHICVTIEDREQLVQTKTFSNCTNYQLVDSKGNAISPSAFTVQATSFSVKIPVAYTRTLPVTVEISNAPPGFDVEWLKKQLRVYTVPEERYDLAGVSDNNLMITIETSDPERKAYLDAMEEWSIGQIPLNKIMLDTPNELTVSVEEGYQESSELHTVNVTLDPTGADIVAERRWIKNSTITLLNNTNKYNFTLVSPNGNTGVTIIGQRDALSDLNTADLQASLNLVNVSVTQEGLRMENFNVALPESCTRLWVSPLPKINLNVTVAE